ncbi:hypothetical protein [Phocaeicola vulgatus]|uniref:hypothetical protein n=1 Tax=Phocaeicola vulgatus TaxID=821 RepID=UPI00216AF867|nr:hypothetical protein [Phocaeicola vulgatus]
MEKKLNLITDRRFMLSKKDIEELATGAVKRYFNTCNLVSPQIQENDKTPDWDGELNLYENKKDIRKNYIGSLRIQVKGKEVPKFKDKETFPVETVFLKNARNEGFVFFVVEVMTDGKSKIFYKKNGSYRNTWRTSIYRATAKDQKYTI